LARTPATPGLDRPAARQRSRPARCYGGQKQHGWRAAGDNDKVKRILKQLEPEDAWSKEAQMAKTYGFRAS